MSTAIKHSGTILLVEDDRMVRLMVNDLLSEKGYNVIEAEDSFHALRLVDEYKIDLLLSDIIMPDITGPGLYQKIIQLYPDTRVLFMSGYSFNAIPERLFLDAKANFIQKPFDGDEMLKKITKIIDGLPDRPVGPVRR